MRAYHWFSLAMLFAVAGCNDGLGIPGGACASLKDAASCRANAACAIDPCGCGNTFNGCVDKSAALKCSVDCPGPTQCTLIKDEASCAARTDCEVSACPGCNGPDTFLGCYVKGTGPTVACPLDCPAPACSSFSTQSACDSNAECHSVYLDKTPCACQTEGCCMAFDHCQQGAPSCIAPPIDPGGPACNMPTPKCEGPYLVDPTGACPTGCIPESACKDCRSTGCGSGTTCSICWAHWSCLPDGAEC